MRRTKARLLLPLLALSLSLSPDVRAATPDAQLVIYIETSVETLMPATLELGDLTLHSTAGTIGLRPVRRILDSADLSVSQGLFVDQPVAPGHYDSLHAQIAAITTHVGQAEVKPELPPEGVAVRLDLEIRSGECTFVILRWRPRAPADSGPHVPELTVIHPSVPPLGSVAFVTNEKSGNVTVIDQASSRVVDCIAVGRGPRDIAYSPLDQLLFVALAEDDAVAVVEAGSRRLLQTVPLRFGDEPSRLLLVAEEQRLYVLNRASDSVTVLSMPSLQDVGRIAVSPGPRSLVRDDRTGYLYVACETAGEIFVYDPALTRPVTSLVVDSTPIELALDSRRRELHVASGMRRRIVTVDLDTGAVTGQIDLCAVAAGVVFDEATSRLYAAARRCREVAVLTPTSSMEIRAIELADAPGLIALSADRRRILATLPAVDRLEICNVTGSQVAATIETGRQPYAVISP